MNEDMMITLPPDVLLLIKIAATIMIVFGAILSYRLWLRIFGVIMVSNDAVGIVTKKFVIGGKNRTLPDGAIIALNGEAGIQADTLAPGVHYGYWPWQYDVQLEPFTIVPSGKIGIVQARDGVPLSGGRVLARDVSCGSFQDARKFLSLGGERGPQISIIPPGTYRINTSLFKVESVEVKEIADNMVGIVTTKDGKPLNTGGGDIAGPEVSGHNSFQNGQAFLEAGGYRGLQEEVILAGRYFLNPLFVTVEVKEMVKVPIATVGVVISYVGAPGEDQTGDSFKHGNLVKRNQKGVWADPLDPGKYPINEYVTKVEIVPTANVVLNWADAKTESHKLDANLSTITARSSDGYTFNLDVSQIIHIPRNEAPKVIARFGSMQNLVTQVLEPTIGNYFRNAAQGSDVIDFLRSRTQRQAEAKKQISAALDEYNINAVDTLIGDITPPPELMKTLTDRKLAEQQKETFATQRLAQEERKGLAQAQAIADTQPSVVAAERQVQIQEFNASATVKQAEGAKLSAILNAEGSAAAKVATANGDATATVAIAKAEAERLKMVGDAQAAQTRAVGTAEADVIKLKIASMEAGNYATVKVAEALAAGGVKLVPEVMVNGHGNGNGEGDGSLVSVLLAGLVRDNLKKNNHA
jgi:uncharacterized membrane protein YqiK